MVFPLGFLPLDSFGKARAHLPNFQSAKVIKNIESSQGRDACFCPLQIQVTSATYLVYPLAELI